MQYLAVPLSVTWLGSVSMMLLGPVPAQAAGPPSLVTVTPEQTDKILANPGMGWETFHRTRTQDKNLPDWIPSTIHYARWGWRTLEPTQHKIDYEFLDGVLKETREAGQQLAFRVMCSSPYPGRLYHPEWLREIGGEIVKTRHGDRLEVEVPVLDDPEILAAHLDFIKRLGARCDGHPDIARLDLGSVGWWGEWHMSRSSNAFMPTPETQKKIVDAYLAAFQKTPLVMLIGGGDMFRHAVNNGTGWRADSLGDLGTFSPTWNHMFHSYLRRLGYRLALKELKHPSGAQPGGKIQLTMKWQNVGSAPCYRPYRLAYRLSNDDGYEKVFVGSVTVNKLLPGSIELFTEEFFTQPADLPPGDVHDVADTIALPETTTAGEYVVSVAVVGVETTQPVVQLGIKGRDEDGWYPVSKVKVTR